MDFIRVSTDGWHFEEASSGRPFVPIGTNYCGVIAGVRTGGYCGQVFPVFGVDEYTEADGVAEARRAFKRIADLGLNVVRTWLEPEVFFPLGRRLDPDGAAKLDALLDAARSNGLRLALGLHLCPISSKGFAGSRIRSFEPPHRRRLNDVLAILAHRYGSDPAIFSWTIVGEAQLPWQTAWMASQWPAWLEYFYDSNIELLRQAWQGVRVDSFAEAPIPPRNIAATLPMGAVTPGKLSDLPHDPWAGSTWRYDWRLFMEDIGSQWIHEQVRALRSAGARQMITVGNNSWIFPGLPVGCMATGLNPYFYLDSVDYICQHSYPAPQCLPGGNGDPLDGEPAMRFWLDACDAMARIYGSMGKPVVLEEFGWYGGNASSFLCPLPYRSEDDQKRYCDRMMETTQTCFAGWFYWQWKDMPRAVDISNYSGLYAADGNRIKPWGAGYAEWARKLTQHPPQRAKAKAVVDLPMKPLYTDDRFHETWWQDVCRDWPQKGPFDFRPVFERKPIMEVKMDLRGQG